MSLNTVDVSSLTVAGTSIGLSSASPTKAVAFAAGARQALIVVEDAPVYMRSDGDAATSADILLNVGDAVPMLGDNMNQVLNNLRFIRKTSTSATLKIIWYNREAVLTERIIRGSMRLISDSGEALTKVEDSAHVSGDSGVMVLAVRWDAGTSLAGTDGDYAPLQVDQSGGLRLGKPIFGNPTVLSCNNSTARWIRGSTSPLDQKGSTGWLAHLFGGVQTGDDWARASISVDELPLTSFTPATLPTQWTYYMDANDYMGVSIVLWVHDPANFENRAEITQDAGDVESAAAWNNHILADANHFFYYGEITGTPDTTPTQGTHYTLAQFKADSIFKTYTIYRITLEFGWGAAGNTFGNAYVADVELNGIVIPMKPETNNHKRTVIATKTIVGGVSSANDVVSESISPGTDWDFDFGGVGYISKVVLDIATSGLTPLMAVQFYTTPPTCNLNDNVANTAPVTADVPYFVGEVALPAMSSRGTGHSFTVATPGTPGGLVLSFDSPKLYAVLIDGTGSTLGNVLATLKVTADMEDN